MRRLVPWLILAAPSVAFAVRLPSGFQESVELSGLNLPTAVRFASDGRIFVAEKSGIIKVFSGLGDTAPTQFADLRTEVHNFADRGLLGLALHPQFPDTPYVYVLYALDAEIGGTPPRWGQPGEDSDGCPTPPGDDGCVIGGRLSRLVADGNVSGGETVMLENWCQQFTSHSIGGLAFAPDGALLVSGGEGASFNVTDWGQFGYPAPNPCGDPPTGVGVAPDPSTSLGGALRSQNQGLAGYDRAAFSGKLLRVDPLTGNAAAGNPLAGNPVPGADRIIAKGFRNPLRFTIRPGTNEIWVGDVGWFQFEEIDRIVPSGSVQNFGWPCYEGDGPQSGWQALNSGVCQTLYNTTPPAVVTPWFKYSHTESVVPNDGCSMAQASISGITFYPPAGGSYPANYKDALFFADYSRGCIWNMFAGSDGLPDPNTRQLFVGDASAPVDLQIGPGGDLFYVDIAQGTLRRIKFFSANQPPLASVTADVTNGTAPLTVHFDASGSSDPEGHGLTFSWDLDGNGTFGDATGPTPMFTYDAPGTYVVRVRVSDPDGGSATASITISAGNEPPVVTITDPIPPLNFAIGDEIHFSGQAIDPQEGALPPSKMTWTLTVHHCPAPDSCHVHPVQDFPGIASGEFVAPDHEQPSFLELKLSATDSGGLSASDSIELDPRTTTLSIDTNPSGLTIGVGEAGQTTPFQRTLAVGSRTLVSAPTPQDSGGVTYTFASWSDGGEAAHDIVTVDGGTTLVATFSHGCQTAGDCDDGNACTADVCVQESCVSTLKDCSAADQCHQTGTCDATTGECAMPPLDLAGGQCECRTMLDAFCNGDTLSPGLRKVLGQRLAKGCDMLDQLAADNPKKAAQLRRLVRRLMHRVTVSAANRIAEPCRTTLGDRLKEMLELLRAMKKQPS